jgi:hypothetical protein
MDEDANLDFDDTVVTERKKSAEAYGGLLRGLLRSGGRSVSRLPIGQLPRSIPKINPQRLPVREIARITDRMSTGWSLWDGWSSDTTSSTRRLDVGRLKKIGVSLGKSTFLGMLVFESYGYSIEHLAPLQDKDSQHRDEYARASLPAHFASGACAGSLHGIVDAAFERVALSRLPVNLLHHGIAHSVLFGSYEGVKRLIINESESGEQHHFLLKIVAAGGLAGQIQLMTSHVTEHVLFNRVSLRNIPLPTLRPLLWSFPGTAIGFLAFEYGKYLPS